MATLYKRISMYCEKRKIDMPELENRKLIGKKVIDAWFSEGNKLSKFIPLHYHTFIDENGNPQKVLSYPKLFNPVIDRIIQLSIQSNKTINRNFLIQKNSFNKKKVLVKKPVYSYKPKNL